MIPKISTQNLNGVAVAAFLVCVAAGVLATALTQHPAPALAGASLGLYLLFAIKVVRQWEKAIKLRFGRYVGLLGPGIFVIVPVL